MLPLFRKKKEWLKWTLLLVIIALGLTTAFMFVNTPQGLNSSLGVQEVARVADQKISAAEYRRFYLQLVDTYRQMYNLDGSNSDIIKQLGLDQVALSQLINRYALSYEASRMGLRVSDKELADQITRFPVFQANGQFIGSSQYKRILENNNLTAQDFEASLRRDLLAEKLQQIVTDGVTATADDIRRDFLERNQEVKVKYVAFDPEKLQRQELTDEKLQEYYDSNLESFRQPEKRKVQYVNIYVPPTDVEPTEEEIQEALAEIPNEEQVRARHILVRTDPDDPKSETEAGKKAQALLKRIQAGEDFAKIAREESEDPNSAIRGGDLGFFTRGQMVPEFEKVAFSQNPGQISGLVKSPFGFHIIQTIEKSGKGENVRRPAATFNARLKKAQVKADEIAKQVVDALKAGREFSEIAAELSLELKESDYRSATEGFQRVIGSGPDFHAGVFAAEVGEVVGPIASGWNRFVARVTDIRPSSIPSLDSIRGEVEKRYREEEGERLAMEAAFDFFHKAEAAGDFDAAAREENLETITTEFFKKGTTVDENLKFSPEVHDQAFSLDVGGISTPILVSGKYFVFQVVEKSEVDEARFEREKAELAKSLTAQKRSEFFQAFTQNVVSDLRQQDLIQVNQTLLNDLTS